MSSGTAPSLTLHGLAPSPPCMAVEAALRLTGLPYERIDLTPGPHVDEMRAIYGEGHTTVPGLLVDGEPVHGSTTIMPRLHELSGDARLYPDPIADAVREAELWADEHLQHLARRLPWGALHFRPEALGTFGGAEPLDGPGTDFAIKVIRATWRYHGLTAAILADDLAGVLPKLDRVEELLAQGVLGGEQPNAADLQIGSTVRVLLTVGDVAPLIGNRSQEHARRWFPDYAGHVPAGAFPVGWTPQR